MIAARLVRLLAMLALLLAPLSMVAAASAVALPAAVASGHHAVPATEAGHCAETAAQPDDRTAPDGDCLDCAVACSAIPAGGSAVEERLIAIGPAQPLSLDGLVGGLDPESDPPPPRTA